MTPYDRVKSERPDLFGKVVQIGSIPIVARPGEDPTKVASDVEGAVMSLIAEILDEHAARVEELQDELARHRRYREDDR